MSGAHLQLLQQAASLYGRGNLAGAETACRQLLELRPNQPDALHILGLVAWRRGDREQAVGEIKKAIAAGPDKPQPHNSLGVLLKEAGDLEGAEAAFRAAIGQQPEYREALTNLGNVLCEAGRLADAETMHRRAIELAPNYADGYANLATLLAGQERWEEAVDACRRAVALEPGRTEFHLNLGNALSAMEAWDEAAAVFQRVIDLAPDNADGHANLGLVFYYLHQSERAVAAHRVAAELRPDSVQIWTNLAAAQADMGDAEAALESCRTALRLHPDSPEAHNCLGLALRLKGKPAEAIDAHRTALRLRPDDSKAHNNLGVALQAQGRLDEAHAAYAMAVELKPKYREAQCNKGMLHLLRGEFEPGWRGYEQGLYAKRPRVRLLNRSIDLWDGTAISGKRIVVTAEQGIGDQIMFASMLPDLVQRGATCLVDLDERLYPLLRRSIDGLTLIPHEAGALPAIETMAIDYQAPIGGLCRWLRPDLASFPARAGYLEADPSRSEQFRQRYRDRFGGRPLVGISWRGGTGEVARVRTISLTAWAPILRQSAFGFVSLQYGDCRDDIAAARDALAVEIHRDDEVDPLRNLDDFAAQTAAMDLVVSVDNSTVHMAGALDVPVWALLPVVPDWRWMLGRSDSPWYRSARLFRQATPGDWSSAVAAAADELRRIGAGSAGLPSGGDENDPAALRGHGA
ncbi:MAG: tetratricopeptide repeat protein [Dongiaceae bacterium]